MSLFDTMTDEELNGLVGTREIGLGEYAQARFAEEWTTYTSGGAAMNELEVLGEEWKEKGPIVRAKESLDDFGKMSLEQKLMDGINPEFLPDSWKDKQYKSDSGSKKIDEAEFQKKNYGEYGLKWFEGMSETRAKVEHNNTVERQDRLRTIEMGSKTLTRKALGVGVDLVANIFDPVNALPIGQTSKITNLGRRFLVGGAYASVENLAIAGVTRPYWEERGVESTWVEYALEGIMGFAAGGLLSAGAGKISQLKARSKLTTKSKAILADALNEADRSLKQGITPDYDNIPGFADAVEEVWNLPKKAAKVQMEANADALAEALNISRPEAKASLIPLILEKRFMARELGVDADELISKFIIDQSKRSGKTAKKIEFDIKAEDPVHVKAVLLDSEFNSMSLEIDEVSGLKTQTYAREIGKGRIDTNSLSLDQRKMLRENGVNNLYSKNGKPLDVIAMELEEKGLLFTPENMNSDDYLFELLLKKELLPNKEGSNVFSELGVKNKAHYYKVLKKGNGPIFKRLKDFAIDRLENGGTTRDGIPIEPSNEWRVSQGLEPVNLQQSDILTPASELANIGMTTKGGPNVKSPYAWKYYESASRGKQTYRTIREGYKPGVNNEVIITDLGDKFALEVTDGYDTGVRSYFDSMDAAVKKADELYPSKLGKKVQGTVINFDGLEGTIKTKDGELVYFDAQSVRKGRDLPGVGEKVELDVDSTGDFPETKTLYQDGGKADRASITFEEDGKSTLRLFKGADETSIIHETGHEFLRDFETLIETGKASKQTILDFDTTQKWLDKQNYKASKADIDLMVKRLKESNSKLKGKQLRSFAKAEVEKINKHEFFARGFETYMRDGTSPGARVARVFEKFREWFQDLYHSREALNADITPEMKDVYSRLMGGDASYRLKGELPKPRLRERIEVDTSEFDSLVDSYNQGGLDDIDAEIVKNAIEVDKMTDTAIVNYKKAGEYLTYFQGSKKDAAAKMAEELKMSKGDALRYINELDDLTNFSLTDDITSIQRRVEILGEELERVKALERKNVALSFRAKKVLQDHVDTIVKNHYKPQGRIEDFLNSNGTPERAILMMLEGDSRMRGVKGAGRAVYGDYTGLTNYWMNSMVSDMNKIDPNIEKIMIKDPDFNSNVVRELWEIRSDGTSRTGITGDTKAVKIAAILSKYADDARLRLNDAGANIGKLDGWVPRRHSYDALVTAKKAGWITDVKNGLDLDRSFPGLKGKELDDALEITYDNLLTGIHGMNTLPKLGDAVMPMPSNMAKKVGKKRVLHFKSSDAELAYLKRYAGGYNVVESMFRHMDKSARMTAIMERLGPNPDATILTVIEQTRRKLRNGDYGIDKDLVGALADQLPTRSELLGRHGQIGNAMSVVTGEAQMVQNMTGAKIFGTIRAAQSASKLMGATLSQLPDALSAMNELKIIKKSGYIDAWGDTVKAYFRTINPELQGAVVDKLGLISDGFSMAAVNRFDNVDSVSSSINRMLDKGFRLSGMTPLTNKLKAGFGLAFSEEWGSSLAKNWDGLHSGFREVLTQYGGLDAAKWDVIRKANLTEVDGVKFFTPEKIGELDDNLFLDLIPENLRQKGLDGELSSKGKAEIKRVKYDLEQAIRTTFVEETRNAVIEPDARSIRTTSLGAKRGSVTGEAMRLAMQFKSFAITYTQRTMGGRRMMRDANDYGGILHQLVGGVTLGYASMLAKDIFKGKTPRDPTQGKTWIAALAQSGGLGILGDFALGKQSRFGGGYTATLAGPAVGTMEDFLKLTVGNMHDAAAGENADFLSDAIGFAQYNIPFPMANMWYTRTALNHAFWYQLREALDPGSMRRMERRVKKYNNQEFFIKPSDSVR